MRRGILCGLLVSGCFAEAPEPIDKIGAPMTTMAAEDDGESSSSESTAAESSSEDSSSSGASEPDPAVCPEWCVNGCEMILQVYAVCRCAGDLDCGDGTSCEREPEAPYGLCRE